VKRQKVLNRRLSGSCQPQPSEKSPELTGMSVGNSLGLDLVTLARTTDRLFFDTRLV
jgi:hypothetical protein